MGCGPSKERHQKSRLRDNFVVERQKRVEDDYNIIEKIGKGSIGIIYLAENKIPKHYNLQRSLHSPRRQYAIKEIDGKMIDNRAFESLKTEIKFLKMLDHPFIIKIFGSYSTVDGDRERLSVVMELCTGGTLDKFAPYKEDTAKILVANILQAVWYLHTNKIIHRDLKVSGWCLCNIQKSLVNMLAYHIFTDTTAVESVVHSSLILLFCFFWSVGKHFICKQGTRSQRYQTD
jgi:serine/threonine protein kinase